ncbi:hypothetical protein [Micromonospora sp. NPDC023814]|uniref:hypothetical protein n=1 Tax=Micromonospora sp. NPDC023814 TaxID=3154596 RepID=UPI0033DE233B
MGKVMIANYSCAGGTPGRDRWNVAMIRSSSALIRAAEQANLVDKMSGGLKRLRNIVSSRQVPTVSGLPADHGGAPSANRCSRDDAPVDDRAESGQHQFDARTLDREPLSVMPQGRKELEVVGVPMEVVDAVAGRRSREQGGSRS